MRFGMKAWHLEPSEGAPGAVGSGVGRVGRVPRTLVPGQWACRGMQAARRGGLPAAGSSSEGVRPAGLAAGREQSRGSRGRGRGGGRVWGGRRGLSDIL